MKKHPELTRKRIFQFIDRILIPGMYEKLEPLTVAAAYFEQPVGFETARTAPYERQSVPFSWGPEWTTAWFRLEFTAPEGESSDFEYGLMIDTGGEGCLRSAEGKPLQGIDVFHHFHRLPAGRKGRQILFLEACCAGIAGGATHNPNRFQMGESWKSDFGQADLVRMDRTYHRFAVLMTTLFELLESLPDGQRNAEPPTRSSLGLPMDDAILHAELLYVLNDAINIFHPGDRNSWTEAGDLLERFASSHPPAAGAPEISVVGHSHLDVAWLWPLRETVRKCSRTFSSMCSHLAEYPDFMFSQGQAQLYKYTRDNYPSVYEDIKKFIKAGRWEVAASMWVEPDCNLISGESLIRQILHGKRFCREEFDVDVDFLWLPDVFGYSAAMPQILRKCGIRYFSTQKISWNQFNRFPHSTFIWRGIDGSELFSHFLPSNCYNGLLTAGELRFTAFNFNEKDRCSRILYPFGYGDGGGGVSREQIEKLEVLKRISGMPKLKYDTISNFFKKAEQDAKDLPTWVGELYLELHRGTYTTHAWIKRANRKNEFLLQAAESAAALLTPPEAYPHAKLRKTWETLLLNQFHDIIPGSSIAWVYDDARRDHRQITEDGTDMLNAALSAYGGSLSTVGMERPLLVYNPTCWPRIGFINIDGREKRIGEITAFGCKVVDAASNATEEGTVKTGERTLENEFLRARFDDSGRLESLRHKPSGRELIPTERHGNEFQLFDDHPVNFDAWDVDAYYQETQTTLNKSVEWLKAESGASAGELKFALQFSASRIVQTIRLRSGGRLLEFHTEIEWREDDKLLKVAFPVDVLAERATYETQFGHIERNTHENTSWDMAAFEVPAHKWADLSENGFGMALINDCKYGHDCHDNVLRLTLLRAPMQPDKTADRGHHVFSYAIMPHEGDFRDAGVINEAYRFNIPLHAVELAPGTPGSRIDSMRPMISCDSENIVVETVKRPEAGGNAIVIRAYESFKRRTSAVMSFGFAVKDAAETNMLEQDVQRLNLTDGRLILEFKPFEIKTIRIGLPYED